MARKQTYPTKAAFSCWQERIAPVFDVAVHVRIVEACEARLLAQTSETLAGTTPSEKAQCLAGMGVTTLVCGAVSKPVEEAVTAAGIRVVSFVTGDLDGIIQAWVDDTLGAHCHRMPGCCGHRGGSARGAGRGRGLCARAGGSARGGAPAEGSPWVCPGCGHTQTVDVTPSFGRQLCPACGRPMRGRPKH